MPWIFFFFTGNEYQQQKATTATGVANKTTLLNKSRVVQKAETPNGGLKTQATTSPAGAGLNKMVMKSTTVTQQSAATAAARKRAQQAQQRAAQQINLVINIFIFLFN